MSANPEGRPSSASRATGFSSGVKRRCPPLSRCTEASDLAGVRSSPRGPSDASCLVTPSRDAVGAEHGRSALDLRLLILDVGASGGPVFWLKKWVQ